MEGVVALDAAAGRAWEEVRSSRGNAQRGRRAGLRDRYHDVWFVGFCSGGFVCCCRCDSLRRSGACVASRVDVV